MQPNLHITHTLISRLILFSSCLCTAFTFNMDSKQFKIMRKTKTSQTRNIIARNRCKYIICTYKRKQDKIKHTAFTTQPSKEINSILYENVISNISFFYYKHRTKDGIIHFDINIQLGWYPVSEKLSRIILTCENTTQYSMCEDRHWGLSKTFNQPALDLSANKLKCITRGTWFTTW